MLCALWGAFFLIPVPVHARAAEVDDADLRASISPARIEETIRTLSSLRSRVAGYPGADRAAEVIQEQFRQAGLRDVRAEEFSVSVPLDEGGALRLVETGEEVPLHGLWPNLVRTPTLPREGLSARLLWGGSGDFAGFNGHDVEGAVVLMDFNTWDRWLNPAMLGAKAVVFVEPDSTNTAQAERKFLSVPLSVPRFWVSRQDGERLLRVAQKGQAEVALRARMPWRRRSAYNILGMIPGAHPTLRSEVIVVEAYYDAMSVVPALAPGAEMACGVAGLLELARAFAAHPPARTLLFVATSAHHLGLRGIDDFLQRHARKEDPFRSRTPDPIPFKLFIGLDLSSHTDQVGVWNSSLSFYVKRYFAPFGKGLVRYARQAARAVGEDTTNALVNGISPERGMSWETYVPGEISVDSELVLAAGTPALSFVTVHDARLTADTPLDRMNGVHVPNLTRQVRILAGALRLAFDDPDFFPDFKMRLRDTLRSLRADLMSFPRRSIVPDLPRAGAVAVLRTGARKSYKGVRGDLFEIADAKGEVVFSRVRVGRVGLEGYGIDDRGDVDYAPDRGVQGEPRYPLEFGMDWREKRWMIVLFPCVAVDFYDIIDPRYLTALSKLTVLDEADTPPEEYGYAVSGRLSREADPAGVVFARPGERIKLALGSEYIGYRFLLLNATGVETEAAARGKGYAVEGVPSFSRTSFRAARDVWALDEARIRDLRRHAVQNARLNALHAEAKVQLDAAQRAMQERRWDAFVRHTRAALGIEARAYPDVRSTQDDVIRGVIFFMALVLPCAYFAERLLFTFADVRRQIAGFFGIFLVIWAVLSYVHPAFELSNPFVILVAFVILTLAALVIAVVASRFDQQMKGARSEAAAVHRADVGRVSASYAAFSLGISNMKRRKLRTGLTFVTLLLLTFTVLSFTSVKTHLRFSQIDWGKDGPYPGLLIRSKVWAPLSQAAYDYARSSFEGVGRIVPRAWYASKDKSVIQVKGDRASANVLGVLGLTAEEPSITGVDRCLISGRWFRPGESRVCILPEALADLLRIRPEEVGRAQVRVFGEAFTVVGVSDSSRMKDLKDLDREPLTPADFQLTSGQEVQQAARQEERERQGLVEVADVSIQTFVHLEPGNVLIVPYEALRGVGGPLQSVAVRFDEGVDVKRQVQALLTRLAVTLFAGIRDDAGRVRVSVYSSMGMTSLGGLSHLFIPILIAALIVLNTMMGSVYERFREIGIYSSVGLAPTHIAFLFVAESCVYAVLGVVGGYLFGQVVAKLLTVYDLLGGLTLNYSSLSAVASSAVVMAVVLLSTVYPARRASQMAVPDVTRRWRPPSPDGDLWRFDFPFTVGGREVLGLCTFLLRYFDAYSEESLGVFYTANATFRRMETGHRDGEVYVLDLDAWLAPFDLGVSQRVTFRATPAGEHDIYTIELLIERTSGEDAAWRRVNQRFINLIRKQFLIWRTIVPESKETYREEGQRMIETEKDVRRET